MFCLDVLDATNGAHIELIVIKYLLHTIEICQQYPISIVILIIFSICLMTLWAPCIFMKQTFSEKNMKVNNLLTFI